MQATRNVLPGLALSALVAIAAVAVAPLIARWIPIPAMVIALFIGIALNPVARRALFQPGIVFCLKQLLRWAVALLGLRVALGEIVALGFATAALVVIAMVMTVAAGFLFARWFNQEAGYGALAGAGTAVCGASATLATSIVVPDYKGKEADVAFVVVAVNALSTAAMVLYPLICTALGFDEQATGIMLGGTIHDVAQVVGAGYAVSEPVGNSAVIVKLFRVFLLLPVVLAIGWFFARRAVAADAAKIPFPMFALVFVLLCAANSIALAIPAVAPAYALIKAPLVEASTWGLLIAIGALGLGTSLPAIAALGWRHVATVTGTTVVIVVVAAAGLMLVR
jgi:uncharacterized integral membrane protein (TIGR00698 family)